MTIYYMPEISALLGISNIPFEVDDAHMQNNPYGINIGNLNPHYGCRHSDKTKLHWSKIRKGRSISEDHKLNISKGSKGKSLSAKHKVKIGIANKNNSRPDLSQYNKNRAFSHNQQSKNKIGDALRGKQRGSYNVTTCKFNITINGITYKSKSLAMKSLKIGHTSLQLLIKQQGLDV